MHMNYFTIAYLNKKKITSMNFIHNIKILTVNLSQTRVTELIMQRTHTHTYMQHA